MSGRAPTGRTNVAALVGTGVGLVVVLVIALVGLWPWLSRAGQSAEGLRIPTGTILANTWLPPLLAAILAIVPAALAGFGIGALRPLGRYSELLLLPFAPFLFVGAGPLAIARFEDLQDAKLLDTFVALIPQGWISIPALVIFTLFFRGQQPRLGILPSLPLIGLVGLATWVVGAQDVLWPRLVASDQEHWTGPLTLMSQTFQFANRPDTYAFGLVLPLAVVVVLVVLVGLLQLTYLDRLTIRIGRIAKPAEPPRPSV